MTPFDAAQWQRLREAFDALVELTPDARNEAMRTLALGVDLRDRLSRLLAADGIEVPPSAVVSARQPSAPLPERLGPYVLGAEIGRGGMGRVFRARDERLDRDVAVKVLAADLCADPAWLQRLRSEARAAGALNHPNVVTVHDVGESGDVHYMTTEFIDGETLRALMLRGRLPLVRALQVAQGIAAGVAAAHERGIVHRDLKPENVMLRRDGLVKVLDFGIAKSSAAPATAVTGARGELLGTIRYMSPEQARGLPVDARTDVFALGVILYELIAGELPFAGGAIDALVGLLEREPVPLAQRVPEVPSAVARLVERALAKDRGQRPPDAGELLRELEAGIEAFEVGDAAVIDVPEVRYARSGDVDIAYQVFGDGPHDIVFVMGWVSHLEYFWRESSFARFLRRLAVLGRVILFDKRGTGLSDRVAVEHLPTLEQRIDDVRAVMEHAGIAEAVLCGISEGGPMCSLFAATHPERTRGLVMIGSYARRLRAADYPWGPTAEEHERFLEQIRKAWGGPVGIETRAPSVADDPAFRSWWSAYLRHGASPGAAVALTRMNGEIDIRHVLPSVRVPTLVVHRTGDRCLVVEEGRFLAAQIPGAQLVELPGDDHLPFVGDQDAVLGAIGRFLAGLPPAQARDRVLATLLVVELRGQGAHDAGARIGEIVADHRGRVVRGAPQLLATFDGPARAIRAAHAIVVGLGDAAVQALLGVHTGECEVVADGVRGAAVEFAESVARTGSAGAVIVSGTVRDLVAGAGLGLREFAVLDDAVLGAVRLFVAEPGS